MNIWVESIQQCDYSCVFIDEKRETSHDARNIFGPLWMRMDQMKPHKLGDMTSTYCGSTNHLRGKYPTICIQFANNNRNLPMYIYIPCHDVGIRPRLADQTAELMVDMLIIQYVLGKLSSSWFQIRFGV